MADQEFHHYLNDQQARPKVRRWWPKIIAVCAVLGGIYGAVVGSVIGTTARAADVIGITAVIVAVLCGVPGARFGFFLGTLSLLDNRLSEKAILKRVRFGRLFLAQWRRLAAQSWADTWDSWPSRLWGWWSWGPWAAGSSCGQFFGVSSSGEFWADWWALAWGPVWER